MGKMEQTTIAAGSTGRGNCRFRRSSKRTGGRERSIMGRFYGIKILNGDMKIEDVPKFWKKVTEKWLAENVN